MIGQRPDTQAVGANAIAPVMRLTAQTVPHDVVFDVLVPIAAWTNEAVGSPGVLTSEQWIEPLATQIEYYLNSGQASDARYEEDLNAAGLVEFFIVFDVTIPTAPGAPPLENTAEARVPLEALRDRITINSIVQPAIDTARNALIANSEL